jgi:peptidoglycan/xylan/chitin deacetylase (PgdA/CDA1 family)
MKRVTITFDNGPKVGATDQILDILGEKGVKSTFFLVGEQLADPAVQRLAERAHAEGHWIGNHTMRHVTPLGMSTDPHHVEKEIVECDRAIGALHHANRYFRPPGKKGFGPHCLSRAAFDHCVADRKTIVFSTNIPRDGEPPYHEWIERALAAVRAQDWAVTIVHDRHLVHEMQNLATFIDRAREEGAEFVQDFPDSVLPMVRGEVRHPIESFVTLPVAV